MKRDPDGDPDALHDAQRSGDTLAPLSMDTTIQPGMMRLNWALVCATCRGIGVVQTTPGHLIRRGSAAKWVRCTACMGGA